MSDLQPVAADVNLLADFLAHQQRNESSALDTQGCIVICGSAIFRCFEHIYDRLRAFPNQTKALILCGGIGHSTSHLYEAIRNSQRCSHLYDEIAGQQKSEAEFMYAVLRESKLLDTLEAAGVEVLTETKSTNCGANAIETWKVMQDAQLDQISSITIVQDPTMSLRTKACFEKVLEQVPESDRPYLYCYPTFIPRVTAGSDALEFDYQSMQTQDVWDMERFLDLLLGEIPRLRDDKNGYGPNGKDFITHVDIPSAVEDAWRRLRFIVGSTRG